MVAFRKDLPPLFDLGRLCCTPGAIEALLASNECAAKYLSRHMRGDWGDLCPDDRKANDEALRTGARLFSAYSLKTGAKIWIITEAVGVGGKRALTSIILPDEY